MTHIPTFKIIDLTKKKKILALISKFDLYKLPSNTLNLYEALKINIKIIFSFIANVIYTKNFILTHPNILLKFKQSMYIK